MPRLANPVARERAASSTPCRAITRSPRRSRAYIDAAGIAYDPQGLAVPHQSRSHTATVLERNQPMGSGRRLAYYCGRARASGHLSEVPLYVS